MKSEAASTEIMKAITALREEVARLTDRIAALERGQGREIKHQEQETALASPLPPPPSPLDEELIAVISAAIAAFLGKKARIRQIRLLGTTTWAQQGRVTIQASHGLLVQHG